MTRSTTNHNEPTVREIELLSLMAQGLHAKRIAQRMGLADSTVESYRNELYVKLGVRGQVALVVEALRRGLVSLATEAECSVVHVLGVP